MFISLKTSSERFQDKLHFYRKMIKVPLHCVEKLQISPTQDKNVGSECCNTKCNRNVLKTIFTAIFDSLIYCLLSCQEDRGGGGSSMLLI